jgi:hypothetical protein
MDVDSIRKLKEAEPFLPFQLTLDSGEQLVVNHRAGLAIAPEDRYLLVVLEPAGYRIIRPTAVKSATTMSSSAA